MGEFKIYQLHLGDCLDVLKTLPDNSIDSVVTDPPYGLSKEPDVAEVMQHWINGDAYQHKHNGFMGKSWDSFVPGPEYWREIFRVLKPGAHIAVFCGTRTWDLMSVALRFAGFENRDTIASMGGPPAIAWVQGAGFPKNLNVAKSADKAGMRCQCSNNDLRLPPLSKAFRTSVSTEKSNAEVLQYEVRGSSESVESKISRTSQKNSEIGSLGLDGGNTSVSEFENDGGEESSLEGRSLHRTRKGLCDDQKSKTPEGSSEWLRVGAYSSSGENVGQAVNGDGRSASHKSQAVGQSSGKLESVQGSQRALDGTPFSRCAKCQKQILPEGLGTALKPAWEVILIFRKPLSEKTVAANVLKWNCGALNIDASRVGQPDPDLNRKSRANKISQHVTQVQMTTEVSISQSLQGRWPANLILSCSCGDCLDGQMPLFHEDGCSVKELDAQSLAGGMHSAGKARPKQDHVGDFGVGQHGKRVRQADHRLGDSGGASRFFARFAYVPKSSKADRSSGGVVNNIHPTCKPTKLLEYLIKLITPPNGTTLDCFAGSGSTGVAATKLGFNFIGIERETEYLQIAKKRIEHANS